MPIQRRFQSDTPPAYPQAIRSKRAARRRHPAAFGARGFSLVEVTVALGIMAFSFLVIFGLLGTGLTSFRQAKGVSVSSQIAQQIFSQVEVMPFNTLTNNGATTYYQLPNPNTSIGGNIRYFDEQGNETTAAGAVYWANVRVLTATPFVGATSVSNTALATVTIQVASNPGALTPDVSASGSTTGEWTGTANTGTVPLQIYTYQSFVAQGS